MSENYTKPATTEMNYRAKCVPKTKFDLSSEASDKLGIAQCVELEFCQDDHNQVHISTPGNEPHFSVYVTLEADGLNIAIHIDGDNVVFLANYKELIQSPNLLNN